MSHFLSLQLARSWAQTKFTPIYALKCNALPHAIAAYQQSVDKRTGVTVADICWLQQWRFPGLDQDLSFTASACTPACNLTVSVCLMLAHLESMMLVTEHQMLFEASDVLYMSPEHPNFVEARSPVATPTPPEPNLLRRFYTRCGVNQTFPLKECLDCTLEAMLTKYRGSLPQARWHAVCMQTIRHLQSLTEALAVATRASESPPGDDEVSKRMREGADPGESIVGATTHSTGSAAIITASKSEQVNTNLLT